MATQKSKAKYKRRRIGMGLKLTTASFFLDTQLLRFETVGQAQKLIELLGHTSFADVRKQIPRLDNTKGYTCCPGDLVNYVDFAQEIEEPFKKRTLRQGIDLEYDGQTLIVVVRYRSYVVNTDNTGVLLDCPSARLESLLEGRVKVDDIGQESDLLPITVGAHFQHENVIFEVLSFSNNVIRAVQKYPTTDVDIVQEFYDAISVQNAIQKLVFGN